MILYAIVGVTGVVTKRFRDLPAIAGDFIVVFAVGLGIIATPLRARADSAVAQQAGNVAASATGPPATSYKGLEEVVVTAQKRSELLKDVPISITAIGGDAIVAAQIADYDDLSRAVPGLYSAPAEVKVWTNIEIRGVSSTSGSATVGIYLDDISITVPNIFFDGSTQPKLFDLDRVEVLRGPQGTL